MATNRTVKGAGGDAHRAPRKLEGDVDAALLVLHAAVRVQRYAGGRRVTDDCHSLQNKTVKVRLWRQIRQSGPEYGHK